MYHGEFLGTTLLGDGRFVTTDEPYAAKNSAVLCSLYTEQCKRWDVRKRKKKEWPSSAKSPSFFFFFSFFFYSTLLSPLPQSQV